MAGETDNRSPIGIPMPFTGISDPSQKATQQEAPVEAPLEKPAMDAVIAESEKNNASIEKQTPEVQALMEKKGIKSLDDLAKMYTNLESALGRKWEKAGLGQAPQASPAPIPSAPPATKDEENRRFLQLFENDPIGTMSQVVQLATQGMSAQLSAYEQEIALSKIGLVPTLEVFSTPEAKGLVKNVMAANPGMSVVNACLIAKGLMSTDMVEQATQQAAASAQTLTEEKRRAAVEKPINMPRTAGDFTKLTAAQMKEVLATQGLIK